MHVTEFDRTRASEVVNSAIRIDAEDIARIAAMMRELRDLTLSRRTFADATRFLRQFAGERDSPCLVGDPQE